jgi:hypothetical protein
MTEEELEASIDYDEEGETDWSTAQPGLPDVVGIERPVIVGTDRDVAE